jgi:RHS repeat-associated protein
MGNVYDRGSSYAANPLLGSPCGPEPGDNGNIGYINDFLSVGPSQRFTYDGFNRLTSAYSLDGAYNHTYVYDSFGNLIVQDNLNPNATYSIDATTNQLNRWNGPVSLYAYDAAGNIISTGTSDIGGHAFTYNAYSQVHTVDGGWTGAYNYDGLGQRNLKGNGAGLTEYTFLNGQPLAEFFLSYSAPWGMMWTDYIYAEGQKIAKIATPTSGSGGSATTNYYLDDHLGTTQVELDASGTITWLGQFTPFGVELDSGGTTMHYKFTGKERDSESGLDFFGARFYGSTMGRWLSPDWALKPEDVPYASLNDPQSLNLYGYVGNNPLSRVDLDGHCPDGDDACIAAGDGLHGTIFHHETWGKAGNQLLGAGKGLINAALDSSPLTMLLPHMQPSNSDQAAGMVIGPVLLAPLAPEAIAEAPVEIESGLSQVQINNAAGKAFQDGVAARTALTDSNVVQNLKVRTSSGVDFEIDVASKNSSGTFRGQEAKASATARLSKPQQAGHPEMARSGATVVSKNKPGYPAGSRLPPTNIEVVRPKQ